MEPSDEAACGHGADAGEVVVGPTYPEREHA